MMSRCGGLNQTCRVLALAWIFPAWMAVDSSTANADDDHVSSGQMDQMNQTIDSMKDRDARQQRPPMMRRESPRDDGPGRGDRGPRDRDRGRFGPDGPRDGDLRRDREPPAARRIEARIHELERRVAENPDAAGEAREEIHRLHAELRELHGDEGRHDRRHEQMRAMEREADHLAREGRERESQEVREEIERVALAWRNEDRRRSEEAEHRAELERELDRTVDHHRKEVRELREVIEKLQREIESLRQIN